MPIAKIVLYFLDHVVFWFRLHSSAIAKKREAVTSLFSVGAQLRLGPRYLYLQLPSLRRPMVLEAFAMHNSFASAFPQVSVLTHTLVIVQKTMKKLWGHGAMTQRAKTRAEDRFQIRLDCKSSSEHCEFLPLRLADSDDTGFGTVQGILVQTGNLLQAFARRSCLLPWVV